MANLAALNRFTSNPINLDMKRSKFKMPYDHKTTLNSGYLVPICLQEVLPGDTLKINSSYVLRMLTPAVPVMDNAYIDIYWFNCPNRILCKHPDDWAKINGENVDGFWAQNQEYTLDNTGNTFNLYQKVIESMSLANYLGLPVIKNPFSYVKKVNVLPFVAYYKIWNEWFRNENTQAPFDLSDYGSNDFILATLTADKLLKVNKFKDYFTSALPSPQKGESVLLPMIGEAPVYLKDTGGTNYVYDENGDKFSNLLNGKLESDTSGLLNVRGSQDNTLRPGIVGITKYDVEHGAGHSSSYADLSQATAATINQLRISFAIQRMLEKDARAGTRYREQLKAHWGVTIPDSTVQIPEYLGGFRSPLNIDQVLQTSASAQQPSPIGTTGAFSNTSGVNKGFVKSFTEFGYVMGVACIRTEQSYSQGISKLWTRDRRFDFYFPAFANIGEQPVYKSQLFINPTTKNDEVFGYQEAWAEYRFNPNLVTGNFAPNAEDESLTTWTYTSDFNDYPVLNSSFAEQPSSQIGDTLVAETNTQFIADFHFDITAVRPMPLYSIPGLIDHN